MLHDRRQDCQCLVRCADALNVLWSKRPFCSVPHGLLQVLIGVGDGAVDPGFHCPKGPLVQGVEVWGVGRPGVLVPEVISIMLSEPPLGDPGSVGSCAILGKDGAT